MGGVRYALLAAVLLLAAPAFAATWKEIEDTAKTDHIAAPTDLTAFTASKEATSCTDGGMIGWSVEDGR